MTPDDIQLPPDLERAARSLEERYQLLRVPSRKVPASEWESLPADIRQLIPDWIPALLGKYSLADGVLEYQDGRSSFVRLFSFCRPDEYTYELEVGMERLEILPTFGFVPIAYESDGSMWVTKTVDGPSGAIYLLDHSDWGGGEPTLRNGLVFASSRLSLLLACMGVSEVSYQETPAESPRSCG